MTSTLLTALLLTASMGPTAPPGDGDPNLPPKSSKTRPGHHVPTPAEIPAKYRKDYERSLKMKKQGKAAQPPNPYLVDGKKPKTCVDKCEMMKKILQAQCGDAAKKKPSVGKGCSNRSEEATQLCEDSCKATGRVDPAYLKAHAKHPKAPPGTHTGPKPPGLGDQGPGAASGE